MSAALVHGSSAYSHGLCRCDVCTEAHRVRCAKGRAQRKAKALTGAMPAELHGTLTGYANWCCRCVPCRFAGVLYMRDVRRRAKVQGQ